MHCVCEVCFLKARAQGSCISATVSKTCWCWWSCCKQPSAKQNWWIWEKTQQGLLITRCALLTTWAVSWLYALSRCNKAKVLFILSCNSCLRTCVSSVPANRTASGQRRCSWFMQMFLSCNLNGWNVHRASFWCQEGTYSAAKKAPCYLMLCSPVIAIVDFKTKTTKLLVVLQCSGWSWLAWQGPNAVASSWAAH